MRRQHLELVTLTCLIAYAAIVLVGQTVHWIPGFECGCHQNWAFSHSVVATNGALASDFEKRVGHDSNTTTPSLNSSRLPTERSTAIESDDACAICQWFSMARQQAAPFHFVLGVSVVATFSVTASELRPWTLGTPLPRGPPR